MDQRKVGRGLNLSLPIDDNAPFVDWAPFLDHEWTRSNHQARLRVHHTSDRDRDEPASGGMTVVT